MKRLLCALALLALSRPTQAQPQSLIDSGSITAVSSGGACAAAPAGCAVFILPNSAISSVTLQVSGTFSATIAFEATSDNVTWFAITGVKLADGSSASSTTGTGQFSFQNSGLIGLRARATGFVSGTATITAVRGYATAKWLTPFLSSVTFTNGTVLSDSASGKLIITGTTPMVQLGGTTSSSPSIKANATAVAVRLADDSADGPLTASQVSPSGAAITAGASTGITVVDAGRTQTVVYKVTVTSAAFIASAVTADVTLATLPAKTQLVGVYADLTQTFACASVCTTATLSFTLGSSAGGTDLLLTFDADAATTQRGLADADLGASMTRATAIQAGKVFSWSATTPVSLRLTSGTGNIGTGAATNLSQGSITFYLITARLP